jgi:murein DD-endopeptidase MepM/ murein hydrolase activator NlpD
LPARNAQIGVGASMPHRSGSYYHHSDNHARPTQARAQAVAAHRHGVTPADYTLGHAGRQVRLGPIAFWIVVGTLVIMGVWTIATGTYFAFRENVLTRLIGRQAEMQFAYEDRVAELRAQIDRITSRQLLDQEQFEQKLDQLIRRQAMLESRAATLTSVADPSITGSIKPGPRAPASELPAFAPPKPSPINDTVIFTAPPDREARLESRPLPGAAVRSASKTNGAGIDGTLLRLQASLDGVETRQASALNSLEENFDTKARRIRGVLVDLGLDQSKIQLGPLGGGTGGPFVPVKPRSDASAFERQVYRVSVSRAQLDQLNRTLVNVPVRKPVLGEIDTSSPFGVRMDPFLHVPAMHTGLDFRGNTGDAVPATAAGTVTQAGWSGGYGNLVEVSHGNGFATRYGHLSQIDVKVGQAIRLGQSVGKLGSTGRSTGPHLHYETRIDGEAVDPQKFLRAGIRLGGNS